MERKGVHHVGLATLDIDRTIDFYTKKMGWEIAWCDILEPPQGGKIKHVFFDTGDGTLFAFMSPEQVPGIPTEFATDINSPQNLPGAFYHYALYSDSVEALEAKQRQLRDAGVEVSEVVDHEWCRSIYFRDPNGVLLEYCTTVREFNEDDKIMKHRDQPGAMVKDPAKARRTMEIIMGPPPPKANVGTPV
jgi:catechol 2,3-dioxygenase-like lactoylglutathione lyase family enzyme